jgi:hypothetical protein
MIIIIRLLGLSITEVLTRASSRHWIGIMLLNTTSNRWLVVYQLAILIEMI